jgi:hypothetical protein
LFVISAYAGTHTQTGSGKLQALAATRIARRGQPMDGGPILGPHKMGSRPRVHVIMVRQTENVGFQLLSLRHPSI